MGHSQSTWKCNGKDHTYIVQGITLTELIEIGIPMCNDCGEDMELVEEVWVEED